MRVVRSPLLVAPACVWVASFALYLATLAPTISWAHRGTDGGDLVTAAVVWGVPHPPGYPTYTFLGHLFAFLPFGVPAFNLNLMSAVCAALTAGIIAFGIVRAIDSPQPGRLFAGVLGGLTFAVAPAVWSQAVIAEVHALNALFVAAVTTLSAPALFSPRPVSARAMVALGLVWGIGVGNSPTLLALAPMVWTAWRRSPRRWRLVVTFALGLGIYLFIPLRAGVHPPINWGYAVTWPNLLDQITAALYRPYVFGLPLGDYPLRLVSFAQLLVAQFGWSGVLLGAWGVARAMLGRHGWRPVALTAGLYATFALGYGTADSDLYLIPVWLLAAWSIGRSGLALIAWGTKRVGTRAGIGLAVLAFGLGPVQIAVNRYPSLDASADRRAADFGQSILAHAPTDAVLVTGNDAHTFALWYYRLAEGRRLDVAVVDSRLVGYAWYAPMLVDQGNAPILPEVDPESTWLERLITANPARPVCQVHPTVQTLTCPNP